MGGWSATGFRRYLGTNETEEKRTTGNMLSGFTRQRRTVYQERAEWVGLTYAGAIAKNPTSAAWKIVSRERVGESGQWRVQEEALTYSIWEDI